MRIVKSEVVDIEHKRGAAFYKLLIWMSWQFNGAIFLEAGTLAGGSAMCLGKNPANLVLTYDIDLRRPRVFQNLECYPNILFKQTDVNTLDPKVFENVALVYLDLSHNGDDEEKFLRKLDVCFKGVLIMDDIECPRRWPKLHRLFNSITRPKISLDKELAASRGTGIVSYGEEEVEVV